MGKEKHTNSSRRCKEQRQVDTKIYIYIYIQRNEVGIPIKYEQWDDTIKSSPEWPWKAAAAKFGMTNEHEYLAKLLHHTRIPLSPD